MAYTKQTVFIALESVDTNIDADTALLAIMKAKEDDMVNRGLYDRNYQKITTIEPGGATYKTSIRKWPSIEAAQEWHDYGSQQTADKGYTWISFDIQSI